QPATPGARESAAQVATPSGGKSGGDMAGSNPLSGVKFYVDPLSNAKRQADEWRTTKPDDAKAIDKISTQPQADWMGEWSGKIETAVSARVKAAASSGSVPVLVAYNIPQRDCGNYSAGGVGSGEEYTKWIEGFAKGIGSNKAVVILEPDGLPLMDCLSDGDKVRRMSLLSDAVRTLKVNAGTVVYIDAGHSHWVGAADMASRLKKAGIEKADGFSLNVSNFYLTEDVAKFGEEVSGLVGDKHFVVDTSRNGLGSAAGNDPEGWCNPSGRALGSAPTTDTGDPLIDAFLWIKRPGESDGTCKDGPAAGSWWAEYALGLAQRSK
ncbi:MAG: glycoside hydrolase family 6 protein, partial [Chloroflexia bacterium]